MKISARNVLSGKVVSCVMGKTTAHVKIQIAGGDIVTSSITSEAVEDLGLFVGQEVSAIVKSSDVLIGVGAEFAAGRRPLRGHEEAARIQSAKRYPSANAVTAAATCSSASSVRLNVRAICEPPSEEHPRSSLGRVRVPT
jgi:molybdopterin-binding protein